MELSWEDKNQTPQGKADNYAWGALLVPGWGRMSRSPEFCKGREEHSLFLLLFLAQSGRGRLAGVEVPFCTQTPAC